MFYDTTKCTLWSYCATQESKYEHIVYGVLKTTPGASLPEERSCRLVCWCGSGYFCIFFQTAEELLIGLNVAHSKYKISSANSKYYNFMIIIKFYYHMLRS